MPDYFLLGTLSDYMGRFHYIDKARQIDRYFPYEKPLANYLAQYIKENYHLAIDTTIGISEMFSIELAKKLNRYYDEKGYLPDSLFQTKQQAYSFLLRNYYRYGEKLTDKIYSLRFANTFKGKLLYSVLLNAGCDRILYKRVQNIPVVTIFYFEAPPILIKYFNGISTEKKQLDDSFSNWFFPDHNEDSKKERVALKKEEAESVEKALR